MATTLGTLSNLIAGERAPSDGETEAILNPATGEELARAHNSTPADVDRAARAARAAFEGWSQTTPAQRAAALLALADAIEEHGEELARLEALNAGKPLAAVTNDEIPAMADNLRFFAGAARCLEGRAAGEYMEGYTSFTRREAVGVIGQITPWNYPLMMAIWKIAPALAAGNTIVLKPAETTPDHDRAPGGARRRHPAGGRAERRDRPRRADRAGADRPPRGRHGLADGLGRDRQAHRAHRGGLAQASAPRARRQGAGDRLRRRRAGERAGDDRGHRLLQRRSGLHRRDARARRRRRLRRRRRRARRAGAGPRDRRHARPRDDARPAQLRAPARARRGLPGAPPGARRGRDRRRRARPAGLLPGADSGRGSRSRRTS